MKKFVSLSLLLCFQVLLLTGPQLNAQIANCVLKDPVYKLDFGTVKNKQGISSSNLNNYSETYSSCPNDGYFSFVARTGDCFNGNWITINQDHTPGDIEGNMMLVNADYEPGTFFITPINGLAGNTTYEFSVWMVNVCRAGSGCIPIPPQFNFILETNTGKQLANFATGDLAPTGAPTWIQYSAFFRTPPAVSTVLLRIINKVRGGCGNDFAMDDIHIRECALPVPVVKEQVVPKPVIKKPEAQVLKPVEKKPAPVLKPVKTDIPVITKTVTVIDTPASTKPNERIKAATNIPRAIATRANPLIKQIESGAGDIVIDLYDNGEIDGDTVSIYHNNELLVSRAGLSAKAVSFRLKLDVGHPHHELVMVANNLGSIPPNTSLMIITTRDKRYEVFISSSEQKNAKVIIELKE